MIRSSICCLRDKILSLCCRIWRSYSGFFRIQSFNCPIVSFAFRNYRLAQRTNLVFNQFVKMTFSDCMRSTVLFTAAMIAVAVIFNGYGMLHDDTFPIDFLKGTNRLFCPDFGVKVTLEWDIKNLLQILLRRAIDNHITDFATLL